MQSLMRLVAAVVMYAVAPCCVVLHHHRRTSHPRGVFAASLRALALIAVTPTPVSQTKQHTI